MVQYGLTLKIAIVLRLERLLHTLLFKYFRALYIWKHLEVWYASWNKGYDLVYLDIVWYYEQIIFCNLKINIWLKHPTSQLSFFLQFEPLSATYLCMNTILALRAIWWAVPPRGGVSEGHRAEVPGIYSGEIKIYNEWIIC